MIDVEKTRIALIGLGYVGLPLAVEFGKKFRTVGFDINEARVSELLGGTDSTMEVTSTQLQGSKHLLFSSEIEQIKDCNIFISVAAVADYQVVNPSKTKQLTLPY